MITIALDEQGDFEGFEGIPKDSAPIFIGGIMYDDKDDELDYQNEKKRIFKYLRKVCESVGKSYPRDLHSNGSNDSNVWEVKSKLKKTITEFFTKGTFEGEELLGDDEAGVMKRKGKYHVFVMLKSKTGKKALLKNSVSEFINDNIASNLYVHMAEEVISRIMFHNPVIEDMEKVRLDIATRSVVMDKPEEIARLDEYLKLGYKEDLKYSTKTYKKIQITNTDVYRTAIEREMMRSQEKDIMLDRIGAKSIFYDGENKRMAYLYLSDIICSLLGFKPKGKTPQEWIEVFHEKANEIMGHDENLVFAYDNIDTYFQDAWLKYEERDFYNALSIMYDGMGVESEFSDYYREKWFKLLKEKIIHSKDVSACKMAIKKLRETALNNNLNQEKLIYIYEVLEKAGENIEFRTTEEKSVMYDLYDTGVAAYCHIGDSHNAKICYDKCTQYAQFIGIERYIGTRNKMVVFLNDMFNFYEAEKMAKENVGYHDEILKLKQRIFNDNDDDYLEHAKTLSQLAQVLAFEQNEKAEEVFQDALDELEYGSPNYLITLSYLLQYYLDAGNKEAYEKLAPEYFGGFGSADKQFNYIVREGGKDSGARISMKFAMYVLVKSVYRFQMDKISDKLYRKLMDIENSIEIIEPNACGQINGHPWEIIYKYLALIALEKGNIMKAQQFMNKAEIILNDYGFTIKAIILFGKAEYANALGDVAKRNDAIEKLWTLMCEENATLVTQSEAATADERWQLLDNVMAYMYR